MMEKQETVPHLRKYQPLLYKVNTSVEPLKAINDLMFGNSCKLKVC